MLSSSRSQISNLPTPAPPPGYGLPEFRHPRCLAYPDHDFADRFDFLDGSTVVHSPLQMALELWVHLAYVHQRGHPGENREDQRM